MRISQQTLLMLLGCFLAGLAAYAAIGISFQSMSSLRTQNENSTALLMESKYLETGLSQWFVNIDLFFSQQEGYLASGIKAQAEQMQEITSTLETNMLNASQEHEVFKSMRESLVAIASVVAEVSELKKAEGAAWNNALYEVDDHGIAIVESAETLFAALDENKQATQVAYDRSVSQLIWVSVIALLFYLAICAAIWRWATLTLVNPLEALTARSRRTSDENCDFKLDQGPKEVKQLGASLTAFASQLHQQKQRVEKEKERVSTIVNTAPSVILTATKDGEIETINARVSEIFGLSEDAAKGLPISTLIPSMDMDQIQKEGLCRSEFVAARSNGSEFSAEVSASPMTVQGEQKFVLVLQDISDRKKQEKELRQLNQRLVDASRQAGIAEIAASILHNIGNVLNSVNTAVSMLSDNLKKSRVEGLQKAVGLMQENSADLAGFFSADPKGQKLYDYLCVLSEQLGDERTNNSSELEDLQKNIKHIEMIISSQQQHAHHTGTKEEIHIADIVEDGLNMNVSTIENYSIEVTQNYESASPILTDRHKLMQIIVNLIRNANDAVVEAGVSDPSINISAQEIDQELRISVTDNGIGMSEETLGKLFSFGFTTKDDGHGFGLHSCSLEAKNLGGSLSAASEGVGHGSTFTLALPINQKEQDDVAA